MTMNHVGAALLLTTALATINGGYSGGARADTSGLVWPSPPKMALLDPETGERRPDGRHVIDGDVPSTGHSKDGPDMSAIEALLNPATGEAAFGRGDDDRSESWYGQTPSHDFDTPEFRASNAVGQVNAQAAYVRGSTGASVTVAVIDEEFDLDHPDLAPNIVDFRDFGAEGRQARCTADATERALFELGAQTLIEGHGTLVAGVIAAARNGRGIHGVAPDASLLALRADSLEFEEVKAGDFGDDPANDLIEGLGQGLTFFVAGGGGDDDVTVFRPQTRADIDQVVAGVRSGDLRLWAGSSNVGADNVARAMDYATAHGADIVNLSLGGGTEVEPQNRDAILRATAQGVIVVASAGNDGLDQPEAPGILAADPRTDGLMLTVGAVDANNDIADFSNTCGRARQQCLVAPGVDVQTTEKGGGFGANSGTSFSAPTVSGSLALLLDLFPTISPQDAVQILLRSATDLGEEGVDAVYGHGLVNLERAIRPIGIASLPTEGSVHGEVATLSSSTLELGGAFGDAFDRVAALQNGIFLDEFRRPFKADLQQRVIARRRGIDFSGVLGGSDIQTQSFVSSAGFTMALALRDDRNAAFETPLAAFGFAQAAYEADDQLQSLRFDGEIVPGLRFATGYNLTAGQQLTIDPASAASGNLFLFAGDSLNPQHAFLGKGNGLSFTQDLTESTSFTVGFLTAGERAGKRNGAGTVTQADLNHRFDGGAELGFSVSFTSESEGFLGSEAGGAFAEQARTGSQFYTLSGSVPVTETVEAFASATFGLSDLSDVNGGVLSSLDRAKSDAFALGVVKKGVWDGKDRLGLMLSQPLRIENGGKAALSVPTAVTADGSIVRTSETVDFEPSGRELNLQLAYSRQLAPSIDMTNYALARSEPGHDANAKPDFGIGMRLRWTF